PGLGGGLICAVTRGEGTAQAGPERAEVRAGHFQYVPRGTAFGLRSGGAGEPLECVGVVFGAGTAGAAGFPLRGPAPA
ncbi:MAG: hypothetical protein AABZ64_14960, partial [Nitrospinota bacterium]